MENSKYSPSNKNHLIPRRLNGILYPLNIPTNWKCWMKIYCLIFGLATHLTTLITNNPWFDAQHYLTEIGINVFYSDFFTRLTLTQVLSPKKKSVSLLQLSKIVVSSSSKVKGMIRGSTSSNICWLTNQLNCVQTCWRCDRWLIFSSIVPQVDRCLEENRTRFHSNMFNNI